MNPINEAQWLAWLEHTGYGPNHYPFDRVVSILNGEIGDTITRDSLQTFLAGWQAGYWTDREYVEKIRESLTETLAQLEHVEELRRIGNGPTPATLSPDIIKRAKAILTP